MPREQSKFGTSLTIVVDKHSMSQMLTLLHALKPWLNIDELYVDLVSLKFLIIKSHLLLSLLMTIQSLLLSFQVLEWRFT